MLSDTIRLLNFDNSVTAQEALCQQYHPVVTDFTALGAACRLWANDAQAKIIQESLDPKLKNALTFIGSGDFHFVSNFLIQQFTEPLTVILFDHHPDWDILPPRYGCGAWVSRILERSNIKKVILLGMASDDCVYPGLMTGNLASLMNERVEMYPAERLTTAVPLRRVPENRCLSAVRTRLSTTLTWKGMPADRPYEWFQGLINAIPTKDVYVSVDKDCLNSAGALTNWEEGRLSADQLVEMLKCIRQSRNIVGMDVTGDYSPIRIQGRWKAFCSGMDHPKSVPVAQHSADKINALNSSVNKRIADVVLTPAG